MPLIPGTCLGPYEVVAPLGAGGMGEVYRARDPRLGREVAIKVLSAAISTDPDRLRRFEQEARATAALTHPHILSVFDIGQHAGSPYIVSELLEGKTLREQLAAGPLPVRTATEIVIQIAHGLTAAHDKGIVHRDLKPENIFVCADGRAKILDFGIAKLACEDGAGAGGTLSTLATGTEPGVVLGTVGYMAPEQVRGEAADHRADLFALGTILYETLSGRRAFHASTTAETMTAILREDPPDLPLVERHIPPALDRVMRHCLEKSAAARFQSATDVAFALETLLAPSGPMPTVVARPGGGQRARPVWVAAAGGWLIAAALVIPAVRFFWTDPPAVPLTRLEVSTSASADPTAFALSPNGRQLVFLAAVGGSERLWLRALDQMTAQPLPGTEGASCPFWAPDGQAIAFFADGKLKRLDLSGSAPVVLANAPRGRGGTWNSEGTILFAPDSGGTGLFRVAASGGVPAPVTRLASNQTGYRFPQFLPDGRRFVFFIQGSADVQGVYLGSLDGAEPKRLFASAAAAQYAAPGYLLDVRAGVLLARPFDAEQGVVTGEPIAVAEGVGLDPNVNLAAYSVSVSGVLAHRAAAATRRQLLWFDRAGKALGSVGAPDESGLQNPELSPDGRRVAVNRAAEGSNDVWLSETTRGVWTRFTFDDGSELYPLWSPDGRRLVFGWNPAGPSNLYAKAADGTGDERRLVSSSTYQTPLDWSPDGRLLLYRQRSPDTGTELWLLPMSGDDTPLPVVRSRFEEDLGQFSPDGRWLAYQSNESGRYEVYVQGLSGPGAKSQVSVAGGTQPRWRRDGKELFYVAPDSKLMAVPIAAASDSIQAGTPTALFAVRILSGVIGSLDQQYAVAPDGRFLVNTVAEEAAAAPIIITSNWPALLKK